MTGPETGVAIIAILTVGSIFRAKYGIHPFQRGRRRATAPLQQDDAEAKALREEVRTLKERIVVLERIATDGSSRLEQEIEQLRDR